MIQIKGKKIIILTARENQSNRFDDNNNFANDLSNEFKAMPDSLKNHTTEITEINSKHNLICKIVCNTKNISLPEGEKVVGEGFFMNFEKYTNNHFTKFSRKNM